MPFLNWRQEQISQEVAAHASYQHQIRLGVSDAQARILSESLEEIFGEIFAHPPGELRLDLPRGWIVFWKPREGESRVLLSRPTESEYVATAALTPEHGRNFVGMLKGLGAGKAATLSESGSLSGFSNVDIVIRRA